MQEINIILGFSSLFVGLLMIILSIPLKNGSVKMNKLYGFRIAKSFESEENWYNINKYGAERLLFWSIPLLIIGVFTFFIPSYTSKILILLFSLAPMIMFIPIVETFLYAKKI